MMTEDETAWLQAHYPNLTINPTRTEVRGELIFAAAYDKASNKFTPLTLPGQVAEGITIRGSYAVLIKSRGANIIPTLQITDNKIEICLDRHFYTNEFACVCGAVEEVEFLAGGYSFPRYLEELVYPFLYEQSFYDMYQKWPWDEYAHGPAGILQSYYRAGKTAEHAEACLRKLRPDARWPRIAAALSGHERITESSRCFCAARKPIRRCHLDVWYGLLKLKKDITNFGISVRIPQV